VTKLDKVLYDHEGEPTKLGRSVFKVASTMRQNPTTGDFYEDLHRALDALNLHGNIDGYYWAYCTFCWENVWIS